MHPFFNPRKRKQEQPPPPAAAVTPTNRHRPAAVTSQKTDDGNDDNEPTELKLAILASLYPESNQEGLLDVLLAHNGSVALATAALASLPPQRGKKDTSSSAAAARIGYQSSLRKFALPTTDQAVGGDSSPTKKKRTMAGPKKGSTLHLYDPDDVAEHTPCTIVHNFLPADEANDLLRELLAESDTFERKTFKLFDNIVSSPHSACFYVESYDEIKRQKADYYYNGAKLTDIRRITPQLVRVKPRVRDAVNREVQRRIRTRYPGGRKLKHQSPDEWAPNSAFVNLYDGPRESVGWHSDQMTYLGPRAVIGSISLGVAREFRVRRVLPKEDEEDEQEDAGDDELDKEHRPKKGWVGDDANEGQISIHLPHNSLLVMHAEMQEEWKHCIAPAAAIDPHPISGRRRINITYRDYRASMHPRNTPRCACRLPCVLRVAQRRRASYGRYFWMCHGGNIPAKESCSYFEWAEFDYDGNPLWRRESGKGGDVAVKGAEEKDQEQETNQAREIDQIQEMEREALVECQSGPSPQKSQYFLD